MWSSSPVFPFVTIKWILFINIVVRVVKCDPLAHK